LTIATHPYQVSPRGFGSGRTWNAADCSLGAVQAAMASAQNGDTVFIPPGPQETCTWTATLNVGLGITIAGAWTSGGPPPEDCPPTICTIIYDSVPKPPGNCQSLLMVTVTAPDAFRLTGLLIRTTLGGDDQGDNCGQIRIFGSTKAMRIDHNFFDETKAYGGGATAVRFNGDICGVLDHNYFKKDFQNAIFAEHAGWTSPQYPNSVGDLHTGDGSFADDDNFGTDRFVFIESNTDEELSVPSAYIIDSCTGSRVVVRYNTIINDGVYAHGTDSCERRRGARSFEVYQNSYIVTKTDIPWAFDIRGGTGLFHDNTFQGNGFFAKMANLQYFRENGADFPPWGICDGTGNYDQNADLTGYKCIDQPGMGKQLVPFTGSAPDADCDGGGVSFPCPTPLHAGGANWTAMIDQQSSPVYDWNNTCINGSDCNAIFPGLPGCAPGPVMCNETPHAVYGRDFADTAPPYFYQPYPYPHYLAICNTGDDPATCVAGPTAR
jgi:hypothetical protein